MNSQLSKEAADLKLPHNETDGRGNNRKIKKVRENEATRRLEFNREQNMVSMILNDAK